MKKIDQNGPEFEGYLGTYYAQIGALEKGGEHDMAVEIGRIAYLVEGLLKQAHAIKAVCAVRGFNLDDILEGNIPEEMPFHLKSGAQELLMNYLAQGLPKVKEEVDEIPA